MIRRVEAADADRIIEICHIAYPGRFDEAATRAWIFSVIENPNVCFVIHRKAFGVSALSTPFYNPRLIRGAMLFLAAEPGAGYEPCAILRHMIDWTKEGGASSYHFGEDTGVNLAPLARRVGATKDRDSYTIAL